VLKPANPPTQIDEVGINYLSKNVAPMVDEITVQAGARVQPQPRTTTPETITLGPGASQATQSHVDLPVTATKDRSYFTTRWSAHDENDDNLIYSLYYRGDSEHDWKLLKSGLTEKFYSFDSGLLPDGGYTLKVVASDAPSHSAEDALSDEKESQRFDVDNTAPRIENLAARVEAQELHVTFHATDDFLPSSAPNTQWTRATGSTWSRWARSLTPRSKIMISTSCSPRRSRRWKSRQTKNANVANQLQMRVRQEST